MRQMTPANAGCHTGNQPVLSAMTENWKVSLLPPPARRSGRASVQSVLTGSRPAERIESGLCPTRVISKDQPGLTILCDPEKMIFITFPQKEKGKESEGLSMQPPFDLFKLLQNFWLQSQVSSMPPGCRGQGLQIGSAASTCRTKAILPVGLSQLRLLGVFVI